MISPAPWSTVAALPDYLLLAQTRQLARHEQALQILVLDHLREIEARRLHLTHGYGSLFDYVVHELGYTAAAAWRRIKAMRLCTQTAAARELLQDGSLNLSNAAQLQNLFERSDRSRGRPPGGDGAGGSLGGAPRSDDAPGEPGPSAPMHAGERHPGPAAGPVLDAAAREDLVKQAAGKSTREVQEMLAEVDPELARRSDRMRALGGGRWELKAAVDAECRHGLEKLQMLLSHRDPHLTLGGLVARLVRDGLDRYDPERPRGSRRRGEGASVDGARTPSKPARRGTETVRRNVVRANGSDVERLNEVEPGDTSLAANRDGAPRLSAAKRHTQAESGTTMPAVPRDGGGHPVSAAKCHTEAESGSAKREGVLDGSGHPESVAKRHTEAERGSAKSAAVRNVVRRTASPPKRDEHAPVRGGATDSWRRRMRTTAGDAWQRRSGCFAGEAAGASGRRWAGRGGGRCPGPCSVCCRCAVRSRPAQRVAGSATGRLPVPDFAGEAACVCRRAWFGRAGGAFAGTAAASRRVALLRRGAGLAVAVHCGGRAAGGVAARPGSLQLCRPPQRSALWLPLSVGDRPHRAVRARRQFGAGESDVIV